MSETVKTTSDAPAGNGPTGSRRAPASGAAAGGAATASGKPGSGTGGGAGGSGGVPGGAHAVGGAANAGSAAPTAASTTVREPTQADFVASLQSFLLALLERQCRMVGAVAGVTYLAASGARQASIGATYMLPPDASGTPGARGRVSLDQQLITRLARYGAEASASPGGQTRQDVITLATAGAAGIYQPDPTHRVLASPLVAAGEVHGAAVVVVPLAVKASAEDSLERLSLSNAAYEAFLWHNHSVAEAHTKARLRETLELLDAAQQSEDAEAMGAIFCHELQRRFGCTRVSIGMIRGARLRVVGVSGADDLNKYAAVVESLENVMEECAEQDIEVVFPIPPEDEADPSRRRVTRAHGAHSTKFGPAALLSLPLRVSGDLVGVVTLEREPSDPFPSGAVPLLRLVAEFIGPAVWTRRMADRGVMAVARDRAAEIATLTFGPRYTGVKVVLAILVIAFLLMALIPIPGRVTAECEARALVSRTISPPFEGFLDAVAVKPGTLVQEGDVLATMDQKETLLSLEQSETRLQTFRTQQDDARNRGQQGERAVLDAKIEEVLGEINLHRDRLARSSITSPIGGTVSRGDIEPLAGAKVDPSQPLFEIIDPNNHVIVLQVKERDIGSVTVGQEGRMAITALPDTKLPIRVLRIRPAAEATQKENVFFVEAEIVADKVDEKYKPLHTWLKPGMTGTARLDHGQTTVLWELCKPVVDAARMRLWW